MLPIYRVSLGIRTQFVSVWDEKQPAIYKSRSLGLLFLEKIRPISVGQCQIL